MRRNGHHAGFSLVEVALAIAVVAFAATAILGLLSNSLKDGRASLNDTLLSAMSTEAMSDLRRQRFVDATHPVGAAGVMTDTASVASADAVTPTVLNPIFFDESGARLKDGTTNTDYSRAAALTHGAVYLCTVTLQPSSGTLGAPGTDGRCAVNGLDVTLFFAWPAAAVPATPNPPINPPNGRTVRSSIARY